MQTRNQEKPEFGLGYSRWVNGKLGERGRETTENREERLRSTSAVIYDSSLRRGNTVEVNFYCAIYNCVVV